MQYPHEKIEENRLFLKMSMSTFSRKMYMSLHTANNLIYGNTIIDLPIALKLENIFSVPAEEWIALQLTVLRNKRFK